MSWPVLGGMLDLLAAKSNCDLPPPVGCPSAEPHSFVPKMSEIGSVFETRITSYFRCVVGKLR
jgi:hypothetical protein